MKIAVVGVGAMGCLLGAYLGKEEDVTLFGHWPEQVAAVSAHGLSLEHPDGHKTHHWLKITSDPSSLSQIDLALVVVKSRQTAEAAKAIIKFLKPDGVAITLQNGLNNRKTLRDILGDHRATLGVTSEGATVAGVAKVRHAGHGTTYFSRDELLGDAQSAKIPAVVELFNRAGFDTHLAESTEGLAWGKLAVNAAINPLTALLRVPNGFLVEHEELTLIMSKAAYEVVSIAEAQGIVLPFTDPAERAKSVARATAANQSSMLQDILRGAPTEIDAICGAVVRIARELDMAVPVNTRLYHLVRQIEGGKLPLLETGDVAGLIRLMEQEFV
ncbi:MAG: ketopantoate reductase family protein [Candidatus Promineofilum sp.]|nr:ketopantoate reductase family protein [Promineifilum sp.]